MMAQTESFGYIAGDGYQAVELTYAGDKASMVILLPETGRFDTFENSLDARRLHLIIEELKQRRLDLAMPKFSCDTRFSLAKTLAEMGMPVAFSEIAADFSGMTGTQDLFIGAVEHKAFVAVDEAGTEAAAATVVWEKAEHRPPIKVTIDHPFIFVIRDLETETILFAGRILNPRP